MRSFLERPMTESYNRRLVTYVLATMSLAVIATPVHADFQSCLSGLRSHALSQGISPQVFDASLAGIEPDMKIIELMENQPEFKTPIWDYLGTLVDDEKVAEGKAMLRKYASTLAAAEQRFGVDRHAILAVWGVESDFGKAGGKWRLMQALPTVICFGKRRNDYFKGEFVAALRIIQRGDVEADKMRGSWAGAFGHTQFMPSTYLRLAVDGDGDGPQRSRRFRRRRTAFDGELPCQGRMADGRALGL